MAAMKMLDFYNNNNNNKKAHSARNNDAFNYCGISLISPNTLHQKYSGSLETSRFNFYFIGKAAPSLVQFFRRMIHLYFIFGRCGFQFFYYFI